MPQGNCPPWSLCANCAMSGRYKYYWDTCVFLAWLKGNEKWPPELLQGIQDVADAVASNDVMLFTSTITRCEVFLSTLTQEQKEKFAGVLRRRNIREIAPDLRITDRAASIREK